MSALLEDRDRKMLPLVAPVPSVPKDVAERRLGRGPAEVVNLIVAQVSATALRLANVKTPQEFIELRNEVFDKYAKLCIGLAHIIRAEGPTPSIDALADESLREFERRFREVASVLLSAHQLEEALFSLSTLRRTYRLLSRIVSNPPPKQCEIEDRQTASEFGWSVLYAQMHLDTLLAAFVAHIELPSEVIDEMLAGFRVVVMAYSCARQGVRLREFPCQFDFSGVEWSSEDQQLAAESTAERESTILPIN